MGVDEDTDDRCCRVSAAHPSGQPGGQAKRCRGRSVLRRASIRDVLDRRVNLAVWRAAQDQIRRGSAQRGDAQPVRHPIFTDTHADFGKASRTRLRLLLHSRADLQERRRITDAGAGRSLAAAGGPGGQAIDRRPACRYTGSPNGQVPQVSRASTPPRHSQPDAPVRGDPPRHAR